ncbi:hypothetical protein THAOC_29550 [Thalassiosira oceanica]|uniref:MYND-type domain-containing protein n=1 Tax=Thalassiosira oceanica TaxID=159749 RepID=K0RR00_THAOC|nr:hypothetical protein THAOC_29550 [Thalassiosira oceanica]|eukprot:EJK51291.1 hypothetical protein THAOC_29550 [Thalassiosira oceanica]
MPSRKKAQGRRNRAKKEATRTAELRSLWEPMALCRRSDYVAVPCEHTLTVPPTIPQESPVVSFMNRVASEGFFGKATCFETIIKTWYSLPLRFPDVWKEDNERTLAIALLLRFLRNSFVHNSAKEGENWFYQPRDILNESLNEAAICCMINLLQLLGRYSDQAVVESRAAKMGDKLVGGNRRDVVKFVAKRLPCTCLKELHRAARKKLPKVGICTGCKKQIPRSELFICTGCRHTVYCSRECQRADWSNHKKFCGNGQVHP